jgi:general secretion pathway protein D
MTVKTTTLTLLVLLTGLGLRAQMPPTLRPSGSATLNPAGGMAANPSAAPSAAAPVAGSPPPAAAAEPLVPAGDINFQGVDVDQVLDVYSRYVGRTLLRAGLPQVKIVLTTETPLTQSEVIQALQGVLALNGIALINIGDKFVKAVPVAQAATEGAAFSDQSANQLPDVGQYVTHIVQLKYIKPSEMAPVLQQFANIPNGVFPIDSNGILIIRDYAENVKRMLEFITKVDVIVPEEFVSEVIPIKYAMVDDIANALNSLGGSSSSIGNATTPSGGGHLGGGGGAGNQFQPGGGGGYNQSGQGRPFGSAAGGAAGSGNTFSQRLQSIIQRASGGGGADQLQLLGPTKIIADERSNSLLVYATQQDMKMIKDIVAKLDVLLPQVLIESVIMDVSLGNQWNFGVSVAQNPKTFQGDSSNIIQNIIGGGGMNNGQSFFNFLNNSLGTNNSAVFGNNLGSGFSYFGNLGPTWDVALAAAASDNSVSIIQRPRIQTSQAKEAQFFVGSTVPYVTSVYYNSGIGGGPSSSYSQLQVGISLDVTPFINPNGLVVMDISQEIDDFNGSTSIQGVGLVPNTDKRSLSSEVAVRDRDTIILGGFIRSEKDKNRSGVPVLQDIPILGNLFTSRSSNKTRSELLVLMRPTVLKTPELAAAQTVTEEQRLPGISQAAAEEDIEQRKAEQAEQRRERLQLRNTSQQLAPPSEAPAPDAVVVPDSRPAPAVTPEQIPAEQAPEQAPSQPVSPQSPPQNNLFQPVTPEGYPQTNAPAYPNP